MVADEPWKSNAVIRFGLSVIACVFLGSLVGGVVHFEGGKAATPALFYAVAAGALGCLAAVLVLCASPWTLDNLRRPMAAIACFYAAYFLLFGVQRMSSAPRLSTFQVALSGLSFQGSVLILAALLLRDHKVSWTQAFGLRNGAGLALAIGGLAALAYLPVGWGLQAGVAQLMERFPQFHLQPEAQQTVQILKNARTWLDRATLGVVTVLLAPVAEEVLFRGVLYAWIRQLGFPRAAFWGASLLFAFAHFNAVTFVPLFALSLMLTALYDRTRNLLAPILAHALFNAVNFVTLLLMESHGA